MTDQVRAHRPSSEGRATERLAAAPQGLLGAARSLLDAGDPEGVGLREIAQRSGVSAAAAYKHFTDKDDLMATVAAEGFRELAAALRAAALEPDLRIATGIAYIDFAQANRGLFRLMFGPLPSVRDGHQALRRAADDALGALEPSGSDAAGKYPPLCATGATKAFIHGVACLLIANVISFPKARALVEETLQRGSRRPN